MKIALCKHALRDFGLSPGEIKCAQALVEHCNQTRVAESMCVSPHTIKFHLRSIYRKTKCRTQTELVKMLLVKAWKRKG